MRNSRANRIMPRHDNIEPDVSHLCSSFIVCVGLQAKALAHACKSVQASPKGADESSSCMFIYTAKLWILPYVFSCYKVVKQRTVCFMQVLDMQLQYASSNVAEQRTAKEVFGKHVGHTTDFCCSRFVGKVLPGANVNSFAAPVYLQFSVFTSSLSRYSRTQLHR